MKFQNPIYSIQIVVYDDFRRSDQFFGCSSCWKEPIVAAWVSSWCFKLPKGFLLIRHVRRLTPIKYSVFFSIPWSLDTVIKHNSIQPYYKPYETRILNHVQPYILNHTFNHLEALKKIPHNLGALIPRVTSVSGFSGITSKGKDSAATADSCDPETESSWDIWSFVVDGAPQIWRFP